MGSVNTIAASDVAGYLQHPALPPGGPCNHQRGQHVPSGAEVPIYRAEAPVQPPPVTFTLVCCQTARVRVAGSTAAANRYLTRAYSRPSRVRWWNQRERAW